MGNKSSKSKQTKQTTKDDASKADTKSNKHDEAVAKGLAIMREGFVKVDHFENIYRLSPKFDGAPNLRQVAGFNIYGTGQPNKSAIRSLLEIWMKEMKLEKCLWVNMRSEPVIYINDFSVSPRDPAHKSENIDFGEGVAITIDDLALFNKELEATVKGNVDSNNGVCVYHKDTYAPLPADRKDKVLETTCDHGADDIYGLDSLYRSFNEEEAFNIELERVTVADEKAPDPVDIDKIVKVMTTKSDANTVVIFNCMMGKGRTTEGMIMACLVQQKVQRHVQASNEDKDADAAKEEEKEQDSKDVHDRWPCSKELECEEYASFKKKIEDTTEEEMAKKHSALSVEVMKEGRFTLIEKLVDILTKEYGIDGEQIKRETDDIIDRCQHLQNMRECVYLSLLRYENESREEQKPYWKRISRQYLQRYYVLLCFNAYLEDVIVKQNKTLDAVSYVDWIKDKQSINTNIGTLTDGNLAKFNWD